MSNPSMDIKEENHLTNESDPTVKKRNGVPDKPSLNRTGELFKNQTNTSPSTNRDPIAQNHLLKLKNSCKPEVPSKPSNLIISKSPPATYNDCQDCELKGDLLTEPECHETKCDSNGYTSKLLEFCLEPISYNSIQKGSTDNTNEIKVESYENTEHDTQYENTIRNSTGTDAGLALKTQLEVEQDTKRKSYKNRHTEGYTSVGDSGIDTPEPNELLESPYLSSPLPTSGVESGSESTTMPSSTYPGSWSSLTASPNPTPPPRKNRYKKKMTKPLNKLQLSSGSESTTQDESDSAYLLYSF